MADEANVESKATELGWVPKEQFKGDPEKWIDAETFVKRGEELMPLLKAANRRQKEQIERLEGQLSETRATLASATDAIEALKETTSKAAIAEVKKQKAELKNQLKEARVDDDLDRELDIQEKIREVDEALAEAEAPQKREAVKDDEPEVDYTKTPEFQSWLKENPWFGKDPRKTNVALGISNALRAEGDTSVGKEFFDKVTKELDALFGRSQDDRRSSPSKVEGDGRTTRANGGGKTYADLPEEAKQACERTASRVVGKGKAFADMKSWREHYTAKFFEE